jgi:hypothetical protein
MARDAVTVTDLSVDAGKDLVTGVAIDPAEGAELDIEGDFGKLLLWVSNTDSDARDVTVVAPTDNPHALRSGLGDLVYEVGADKTAFLVVESARFAQTDGALHVDFETGMTGFIAAYRLPANS